jgi:hypothetical protein
MTPAGKATLAAAPIAFHGGSSATLANGSPAAAVTTAMMTLRRAQAGRPASVATMSGPPIVARRPPMRATPAAAMAGATSGTTMRLTTGDTSASRPNARSTTGSVAACAARDTARHSTSQPGARPADRSASHEFSGDAHARIPAVASADSWKPASAAIRGSARTRSTAAQPSAAAARPARPLSRASRTTPAIAAARTTDADAPAKST